MNSDGVRPRAFLGRLCSFTTPTFLAGPDILMATADFVFYTLLLLLLLGRLGWLPLADSGWLRSCSGWPHPSLILGASKIRVVDRVASVFGRLRSFTAAVFSIIRRRLLSYLLVAAVSMYVPASLLLEAALRHGCPEFN